MMKGMKGLLAYISLNIPNHRLARTYKFRDLIEKRKSNTYPNKVKEKSKLTYHE